MTLLRAKGYSMIYQYGGCPILTNFALYVLRVTHRYETNFQKFVRNDRTISEWERTQLLEAIKFRGPPPDVGTNTRYLVKELYQIEISEQLELERYFDKLNSVQAVNHPILEGWGTIRPQWESFFRDYNNCIYRKRVSPETVFQLVETLPNYRF
jgi:hypothetical protein